MLYPSTFSIVAYDPHEKAWGVAVASKFLGAGAVVPWARANAGAVATQSYANTSYGPRGLDMMESGLSAEESLARLLVDDSEREHRQVGLVDPRGGTATFTGRACLNWAGGLVGEGFTVQGNILIGEHVIQAMAASFSDHTNLDIVWRLFYALQAGDQAGGDRRGRQSAGILVVKPQGGYGGFNDRWVDYRVDDHPDPVTRLREILNLHELYFGKSSERDRVKLAGKALVDLQKIISRLGYYSGSIDGEYTDATRSALEAFIGNENFEERTDFEAGLIDRPVFEYLIANFEK